jgi:selenocysteine lyase/cysteine desulfurase
MTLRAARQRYPGVEGKAFLDAACVSLSSVDTQQAIAEFLQMALLCPARDASEHHIEMDRQRREAALHAARLLQTEPRNVALVESTTFALNAAAAAIRPEPGSNILVADTEFMQVAIPWQATRELRDVEIRPVPSHEGGSLAPGDFERAMDSRTRVVCVSSVQWCTGVRLDMRRLGELCRARGIWLVVDAIQEVGAMAVDVRERYADFLIAGGHKWLNAPFGCGILAVSDRVLEELRPPCYGYLSMQAPDGGWGQYFRTPAISPYTDFRYVQDARAYEIAGTSNYPGAIGLAASLRLIDRIGISAIEAHIRKLSDYLRAGLARAGASLVTPEDPAARSGITVFRRFDEPARDQALVERLLDDKVYVSMRYTSGKGGIRVSTHYFNNEDDIDRLVRGVERCTE